MTKGKRMTTYQKVKMNKEMETGRMNKMRKLRGKKVGKMSKEWRNGK